LVLTLLKIILRYSRIILWSGHFLNILKGPKEMSLKVTVPVSAIQPRGRHAKDANSGDELVGYQFP